MKHLLYILLLLPTLLHAQHDTRANLDIPSWSVLMAVTPDGRLWLRGTEHTYYADSIDADWHNFSGKSKPLIYDRYHHLETRKTNISSIHFFNHDTGLAIITTGSGGCACNGQCYRTIDGGVHWAVIDGGDTMENLRAISCISPGGNAWLAGASGIFFSADYGLTWAKLSTPPDRDNYIASICMATTTEGIGSTWDSIYITHDNWHTYHKIPIPEADTYHILVKSLLWGRYIVAATLDGTYYTDTAHIHWRPFPDHVWDMTLDPPAQRLYTLMSNGWIRGYTSPQQYTIFNRQPVPDHSTGMIVAGNTIYAVKDRDIIKITPDTTIVTEPYTTDDTLRPILYTEITHANNAVAYVFGRSLVVSHDSTNWYRECVLPFPEGRILRFISDTVLSLWNGNYQSLYNLASHHLTLHKPHDISPFLAHPIVSINIYNACYGCTSGASDKIVYARRNGSERFGVVVQPSPDRVSSPWTIEKDTATRHDIIIDSLVARLQFMSDNPDYLPTIGDFMIPRNIRARDLNIRPWTAEGDMYMHKFTIGQVDTMLSHIDTVSPATLKTLFDNRWVSSTECTQYVTITNDQNDTLTLSNSDSYESRPWHLPWQVQYHTDVFKSYDPAISRFVLYCKPPYYYLRKTGTTTYFIQQLIERLWEQK